MKGLKVGAVIFGAVIITALGIDAADTLTGNGGTMLGQLISSESGVCPIGMVEVPAANSFTCVDRFEAATDDTCQYQAPSNQLESAENLSNTACGAVSVEKTEPWRNLTREQAMTACARAGKRLPTATEWYQAALGTVDDNACNTTSNNVTTAGTNDTCVSAAGAEDMIGNVWEWVSDDVVDGQLSNRNLPEEGYVAQVDGSGIPTVTTNRADELFSADYFWSDTVGAYGMLRGGFYGSESDAGIYSVHAKTLPTTAGVAIGFRCVQ